MLLRLRDCERLLFFFVLASSADEWLLATTSPFLVLSWTLSSVLFFGVDRELVAAAGAATSAAGFPLRDVSSAISYETIKERMMLLLTKLLHVVFVSITADDALTRSFSLNYGRLNGYKPAVTFGLRGSLEGVFVTIELEKELIVALFGHISCFALPAEE